MAVGILAGSEFYRGKIDLFKNFDFTKMEQYERYQMDADTVEVIRRTLQEFLVPSDGNNQWEVSIGGKNFADTMRTVQRLFKDCEVVPYIYRIPNIETHGADEVFHSRIHLAAGFSDNTLYSTPGSAFYDTDNTTQQQFFSSCRASENRVAGNNNDGYEYDTLFSSNYSTPQSTNWLYKMPFSKSGKVVMMPTLIKGSQITEPTYPAETPKWAVIKDYDDVFEYNVSIIEFRNISNFGDRYPNYYKLNRLTFFGNDSDGNYSATNQRTKTGTYTKNDGTTEQGASSLVFFVKINHPFYQNGTEVISTYSYACFNFLSLFFSRGLGDKNEAFFKNADTNMIDTSFRSFGGWFDPIYGQKQPFALTYPPFPYVMSKLHPLFKDNSICITTLSGTQDLEHNTGGNPVGNGSILFTKNPDAFVAFFRKNNIPASLIQDEITSKNTEDWKDVDVSTPQPGSGGYTPEIGGGSYDETPDDAITGAEANTSQAFLNSSYVLDKTDVRALQQALINTDFSAFVKTIFQNNPEQGIINLISYPINLGALTTAQKTDVVVIGCNLNEKAGELPVHGKKVESLQTRFYLGEFYIKEKYHSFADYDSTHISIYLPFVGYQSLDASIVMGRHLKIYFNIEYADGSIMYIIYCSNDRGETPNGYFPLITYQGQCGTVIPLSIAQSQQANMNKIMSGINLVKGTAESIASMNPMPLIGAAGGAALSAASNKPTYTTPSAPAQGIHAYAVSNPNQCFLIISYPRANIPAGYGSFNGYATQITAKLSELSGYTMCDNTVRIDLPCTEAERDMLKSLLTSGIVIN